MVQVDEEPQRLSTKTSSGASGRRSPSPGRDGGQRVERQRRGRRGLRVLTAAKADQLGLDPEARALGYTSMSRAPEWFTLAPWVRAARDRADRLAVDDVDLFEVNEAFSSVPMALMKELQIPHEKVNVHGGAVAARASDRRQRLAHPGDAARGDEGSRSPTRHRGVVHRRRGRRGVAVEASEIPNPQPHPLLPRCRWNPTMTNEQQPNPFSGLDMFTRMWSDFGEKMMRNGMTVPRRAPRPRWPGRYAIRCSGPGRDCVRSVHAFRRVPPDDAAVLAAAIGDGGSTPSSEYQHSMQARSS